MIALFIASLVFNPEAVQSQMFSEVGGLIGKKSADAIESTMAAQYQSNKGNFASTAAIITLIITATGMFIELQDALNTIWKVEPKPGHSLMGFIRNRLMSFAMVVGIGFLLLVSLIVSAALAALSRYVSELIPGLGDLSLVRERSCLVHRHYGPFRVDLQNSAGCENCLARCLDRRSGDVIAVHGGKILSSAGIWGGVRPSPRTAQRAPWF